MKERFEFKQFVVCQDKCAMKVGTDGVLLGAWAQGGRSILDVGTGTGLIALMMAQRFPQASVVGIDIEPSACSQASDNVSSSPFADRIRIDCCSLQDFVGKGLHFDAIVSNTPFFENSLKNPNQNRTLARHTDSLPFDDLLRCCYELLDEDGVLNLILPADAADSVCEKASFIGYFLLEYAAIRTTIAKKKKRIMLQFVKKRPANFIKQEFVLMENGVRSAWYKGLTDAFYTR